MIQVGFFFPPKTWSTRGVEKKWKRRKKEVDLSFCVPWKQRQERKEEEEKMGEQHKKETQPLRPKG